MEIIKSELKDLLVIQPKVFNDDRGWFSESYNKESFNKLGIIIDFKQDNHSFSAKKGTLRGLHVQINEKSQIKLVRCTRGSILDVVVDLRKTSPTFLKSFSIILSAKNQKQLLVPKGFAHGFVTLEDDVEVQYKVDEYYSRDHEKSIKYNDPIFKINWLVDDYILSTKDKDAPLFKDSGVNFE